MTARVRTGRFVRKVGGDRSLDTSNFGCPNLSKPGLDTSPDAIRKLRGSETRAAFAHKLGVSPLTIYRWELPEDADGARRPRGTSLRKLASLSIEEGSPSDRAPSNGRGTDSDAPPSTASAHLSNAGARTMAASVKSSDELASLWPYLERILAGDLRQAPSELVERLARRPPQTADGKALAAAGMACADLFGRADGRAALAALASALADADAGRLHRAVAARVLAIGALVHAAPDGSLFDMGKVHAFGARVESLAYAGQDDDAVLIARVAAVSAAQLVGDAELLARAFDRMERSEGIPRPFLLGLAADECHGLRLLVSGQAAAGTRVFESIAERAEASGAVLAWVRAVAHVCIRRLYDLGSPQDVVALVERADQAAKNARLATGSHTTFLWRSKAEALFRQGRVAEARAVLDELDAVDAERGFPSLAAVPGHVRIHYTTGNVAALRDLAARLKAVKLPALQAIATANVAYIDAMRGLAGDMTPIETAQAFSRANDLARTWSFLEREVAISCALAHLLARQWDEADAALRQAQRLVETLSSAWSSAQLLRIEGTLLAGRGEWSQARPLLEAAVSTLERGGDLPGAALCHHVRVALSDAYQDLDAQPGDIAKSEARLAELGLAPPAALSTGLQIVREHRGELAPMSPRVRMGAEPLLVPFQRLAVRGANATMVERELVSVSERLLGVEVTLEQLARCDGSGGGAEARFQPLRAGFVGVEFGDGSGRRLRIAARGPLDSDARAVLSLLAMHASLALEIAALRDVPSRTEEAPDAGEIAGFVAASPSMRRLRGELGRLAGSRATVIVTGESGSGKEVVARALHSLSERRQAPFVAFNCAAVPRDLFEGQLFGYRRGAFTGAVESQPGVIRAAAGGTLFLDEIGELPLEVQPKLLRFLDSGEILPLGERKPLKVDVRVVTATHRDLSELVRRGLFREDLYFRLHVVPIAVPPLRQRPEDVVALARYFVKALSEGGHAPNAPAPVLAPDAIARLTSYPWPGNVRELRNVIERALAFSPTPTLLRAEHLSFA